MTICIFPYWPRINTYSLCKRVKSAALQKEGREEGGKEGKRKVLHRDEGVRTCLPGGQFILPSLDVNECYRKLGMCVPVIVLDKSKSRIAVIG